MAKTTAFGPSIRPGTVVEFMHGDQPQLAWVLEDSSGKLRLLTINKRETKLPAARLLPWTGPVLSADASRQDIQNELNERQEARGEIQAGLDVMELWELAQGEVESAPLDWFAGLLWEDPDADRLAALGRAMLQAKTHFKFRPPLFDIYPADKVEARLQQQAEEKEREAITSAGQTLLQDLWSAYNQGRKPRPDLAPELAEGLARILRRQVAQTLDENERKIWTAISKGLPDLPHLALVLAQTWGVLPAHHNYHLDEAEYAWGDEWSQSFNNEINEIEEAFSNQAEEPELEDLVSIDAATTRDIDDAFRIERDGKGFKLTIALARPDAHWTFGSSLDRAVQHRVSSLYLPEGTSHMMPERFGTGLYSLMAGETRPALVTDFHLGPDGALDRVEPRTAWVRIRENTTYEAADAAIAARTDESLVLAHDLATRLLERRLASGACVIRRPEPVVTLEGEGAQASVEVSVKTPCPLSELVISEFMILANSGLALWARDHEVPLLHRTQDIALPPEAAGIFSEPAEIMRSVKLLLPPTLETNPRRHAALAVPAYAPITSPLRRYTDLINMSQVCTFLTNGTPRLDKDELDQLIIHLNMRVQAVGAVQRFRPRYWKLVYLAKRRREFQPAVLVDEAGPMATLSMPHLQINVRAPKKLLGDKLYPGQRFQINFSRIDPLTNEIRLGEALEE
ncbi:ribonuclease catalytic domain-containing protein [Pseudodesulfovibrio indicus]|uniref:Exoribonuclease-2 n=1 Tax=Pseudodesulfovibrio indicus TaxID=1716143 RepID=A0A126QM65_9BACT|nr:ribonuclease catalytic domain-containing protein [Pseudodesulfovibrio indicus]AMK11163.1 ribonuclease II [Pseudodesulfovibrio indicus]TDT92182.1 exoribonuclease-2 [Pseudodesulfovibrio indicus]